MSPRINFDALYRSDEARHNASTLIPWDIGGPQPVVKELVAYGALRGEVLDSGTGLGHHAIYFASKGYSVTGIDSSPAAIEQAKRNAQTAGVTVDFQLADATTLDGFEGRFDTVVDSALYHTFQEDEDTQNRYMQALHRATRPGARLFMFEFGRHNVNGVELRGLSAEDFRQVLPASGWRIDYLGTTTYQDHFTPEIFASLSAQISDPEWVEMMKPVQEQFQAIAPLLKEDVVHMPFWSVHATRID
ncbi:methyltransferase [Rhodococcus sp. WMMA185]|uniref:class I SAM-dependent methyltransferase n=1 Tax=Rhodococcus sp. WMMA185 TaxID=679318 RepID=UPI0008791A4B|nr:class I SAM-dependent methyltransferase [Rhodococcus sp. WMMA185]AOW93731.1 methyltransferase [Rhodococcus sp. WMMA185]